MPIKGLAVHVVTTKRKVGDKVYQTHLLRHSYREGDQVKSKTVANLSSLPESIIEMIRLGLKGEPIAPATGAMKLVESRPHGHVAAVVGTIRAEVPYEAVENPFNLYGFSVNRGARCLTTRPPASRPAVRRRAAGEGSGLDGGAP